MSNWKAYLPHKIKHNAELHRVEAWRFYDEESLKNSVCQWVVGWHTCGYCVDGCSDSEFKAWYWFMIDAGGERWEQMTEGIRRGFDITDPSW